MSGIDNEQMRKIARLYTHSAPTRMVMDAFLSTRKIPAWRLALIRRSFLTGGKVEGPWLPTNHDEAMVLARAWIGAMSARWPAR